MNAALPDVSLTDLAPSLSPLNWVGMRGIDLPVTVAEPGYHRELHARADVQVDLPAPHVKGIHMSRLYRLLDTVSSADALSPECLQRLLHAMIDSHRDCESSNARLKLTMQLLTRRPALVTPGLNGWKSYPVEIDAVSIKGQCSLRLQIGVGYSSTCPCSAALARQLVSQRFLQDFADSPSIEPTTAADWLRRHATLATPHSQRSEAMVCVDVPVSSPDFGIMNLIDKIEQAVGTPVQTAVKRSDEQAFAALNGQNLMFVEDAARRIRAALEDDHACLDIHVRHLESLHPHDAVAWSQSGLAEVLA